MKIFGKETFYFLYGSTLLLVNFEVEKQDFVLIIYFLFTQKLVVINFVVLLRSTSVFIGNHCVMNRYYFITTINIYKFLVYVYLAFSDFLWLFEFTWYIYCVKYFFIKFVTKLFFSIPQNQQVCVLWLLLNHFSDLNFSIQIGHQFLSFHVIAV